MKSTVVDESLSTNATRVLFQRKTTSLLHICMHLRRNMEEMHNMHVLGWTINVNPMLVENTCNTVQL